MSVRDYLVCRKPLILPPSENDNKFVSLEAAVSEYANDLDRIQLHAKIVDCKTKLIRCSVRPPLDCRRKIVCEDLLSSEIRRKFDVTLFGPYAVNVSNLDIKEGERILFRNPHIVKKRKGTSFEDDKNDEWELFIGDLVDPVDKVPLNQSRIHIVATVTPVEKGKTKPSAVPKKVYSLLKDCTSTQKGGYNVWAVITRVRRKPGRTRGTKLVAQIYIQDETFEGTYGFPDFQFSILSDNLDHFPPLVVGSVIRIHYMILQMYNEVLTGRVYDARAVTVVLPDSDEVKPISHCADLVFTEEDEARALELRSWWLSIRKRDDLGMTVDRGKDVLIRDVKKPSTFDLYCHVLLKFVIEDERTTVIRVTDGTLSPLNTISLKDDSLRYDVRDKRMDVDIFIRGHKSDIVDVIEVGNNILLSGVVCQKEQKNYRFVINETSASGVIVLPGNFLAELLFSGGGSSAKKIKKNLERGVAESQPDPEIEDPEIEELIRIVNEEDVPLTTLNKKSPPPPKEDSNSVNNLNDIGNYRAVANDIFVLKSQSATETQTQDEEAKRTLSDSDEMVTPAQTEIELQKKLSPPKTPPSKKSKADEEEEEEFHTCPETMSPLRSEKRRKDIDNETSSPKQIIEMMSIKDLKSSSKKIDRVKIKGIIRSVTPTPILYGICEYCCRPKLLKHFSEGKCDYCEKPIRPFLNFRLVLESNSEDIELYVTGYFAELFIECPVETFIADESIRTRVSDLLREVINKRVEVIVSFSSVEDGTKEYILTSKPKFI